MTDRDAGAGDWQWRPWIMAAVGTAARLLFHFLSKHIYNDPPLPAWRQAAATFVAVSALSFIVTAELRRLSWAFAFAAVWGLILASVGWFTAQYNFNSDIFELPFLSGILAVLLAGPLFQTIRDEGAWRFPYARLHRHAWTDAVIGAASCAFIGAVFILTFLIAELFHLIGADLLQRLLEQSWFDWTLAGLAFGAAFGLLRERDALLATLQRLVMVVLSVLAPVLAVALALFLGSLPFAGLDELWSSGLPTTPVMLCAGAAAILLCNAVIGNGKEDGSSNRVLRWAALGLILTIFPLAIIAAISIYVRVQHYGWTPARMWGVVAVVIALAYGVAGYWSVYRGRRDFDEPLRPVQTGMAIGLCGIALFLALPILDFGAISTRSQIARLNSGRVTPDKFDWEALAFDFGPAGRARLQGIARGGSGDQKRLAEEALRAKDRYDLEFGTTEATPEEFAANLRTFPAGFVLSPEVRKAVIEGGSCARDKLCLVAKIAEDRVLVVDQTGVRLDVKTLASTNGVWEQDYGASHAAMDHDNYRAKLKSANVEIRTVERRQLFIDGKPIGGPFE